MADYTYEFDPTGTLPANLITNEEHTIAAVSGRDFNVFIPKFGPFFNDVASLVVTNSSGVELVMGADWWPVYKFQAASRQTAKDIYAGIMLANRDFSGLVKVTYQTLGGEWSVDLDAIALRLAQISSDPRTTTYEEIQNLPATFPPIDHVFDLENLRTSADILDALYAIAYAIGAETGGSLAVHLLDKNNPHSVSAAQIGLGQVSNYGLATTTEAELGEVNTKYMTPALTKAAIIAQVGTAFTTHAAAPNPHGTSAVDVGLGAVVNAPMATDLEALAGTVSALYINPVNLAYTIANGIGATFTAHAEATNPHGTSADDVGLGLVINGGMADNVTALAGEATGVYINPANLAYTIANGIGVTLAEHINDLAMHTTTAEAIGLGSVVNAPMASNAEALAGTEVNLYINPVNLAYTIANGIGASFTAHAESPNPHGTSASDVGLGAVVDAPMATDLEALAGTEVNLYINPVNLAYTIANGIGATFEAHVLSTNPHGTSASDVGLGSVDDYPTANALEATAGTAQNRFLTPYGGTLLVNEAMKALTDAAVLAYVLTPNPDATPVWVPLGAFTGSDTENTATVFEVVGGDAAGLVPPRVSVNIEGSVDAYQAELLAGDVPTLALGYADIGGGGEITSLSEVQTFTNVSLGGMHLLAIRSDDTIAGYGYAMDAEISAMEALPGPIVQVWAGISSSASKDSDGNMRFSSAYNATIETDLAPLADIKDVITLGSAAGDTIVLLNDNTLRIIGAQWALDDGSGIPTGGRDNYTDLYALTNVKQLVNDTNTVNKELICLKQDNTVTTLNLADRYCAIEFVAALPTTTAVTMTTGSSDFKVIGVNADNSTSYFGWTGNTPIALNAATDVTWCMGVQVGDFFAYTTTDGTLKEDGALDLTTAAAYASNADHIVVTPYGAVVVNTDGTVQATIGDATWNGTEPTNASYTGGKAWLEAQTNVGDVAWGGTDWGWCAVKLDNTVTVFDDTTEMGTWLATQTSVAKVVMGSAIGGESVTYVIYTDGTVGVSAPTGVTDPLGAAVLTNVSDIQVSSGNRWGCARHTNNTITPLVQAQTYLEPSGLNHVATALGSDVARIEVRGLYLLIERISGGHVLYHMHNTEAFYQAPELINVHQLLAAKDVVIAHHTDKTVTILGNDNDGYVTLLRNAALTNVVQVSAAGANFGFLTGDLVVHAYGADTYNELSRIDGQINAVGISFSANGTAALLKDGTIITYSQVADLGY